MTARPVSPGKVRGQLQWLAEHVVKNDPAKLGTRELFEREERLRQAGIVYESPIRAWNDSHDIRDVVGEYVALNRQGIGHCPWPEHHKEGDRHRSFKVWDNTQKYFCFVSREGGRAADFVMKYHRLTPHDFYRTYCQESAEQQEPQGAGEQPQRMSVRRPFDQESR